MTSRQRFLAALQGRQTDRPPVGHISALTSVELQEQTGCRMPGAHHDPRQLVRLCGANHDILGFDFVTFLINYFNEPAALGCAMDWGAPDRYPMYTSHPWLDDPDPQPAPDLLERPHIRCCLEAVRLARQGYGDKCGVLGKIMGPLSLVQVMLGVDKAMMELITEPEKTVRLLNLAAAMLVPFANAQMEAGADAIAIGEGGAGANMLSPEMYRTLLMDVHHRMIRDIKGPTVMHICGDITPRLDSLGQLGLDFFHFDSAINPRVMAAASQRGDVAARHFRLIGNISTVDLMRADLTEIRRQVRACVAAGVDMIAPGCATAPTCPNRNLAELVLAVAP